MHGLLSRARSSGQRLWRLVRRGPTVPLALAGLAALALAAGPGARAWTARGWPGHGLLGRSAAASVAREPGSLPQEPAAPRAPAPAGEGKGFSHTAHRAVQCTACHMSVGGHGVLKVRTNEDCVACHHGTAKPDGCVRCHEAKGFPAAAGREVQVRTSVAKSPATRTLPFAHSFHASVACQDCHGAAPRFSGMKDCSSCHERHHTERRDCQRCHRPENVKSHPALASHTGCEGAGCHSDRAVASLAWSRNVCVACHQDKARHEAGRECATCHQVPALHAAIRKEAAR